MNVVRNVVKNIVNKINKNTVKCDVCGKMEPTSEMYVDGQGKTICISCVFMIDTPETTRCTECGKNMLIDGTGIDMCDKCYFMIA